MLYVFFFKQKTAYEILISDWSSDGCSSDLAVVVLDRLRHEGRGLAIGVRDLMHDIFVDLHAVGGFGERAEGQAELVLRRGDLMVVLVAGQAHFEHRRDHLGTDVDRAVDRRDREIAALGARAVGGGAALIRSDERREGK